MPWPTEVLTVDHQGRTALVHRRGRDTGPQVVLVHGIGVAARPYLPLARVLARSVGVHVLELPGFGRAPRPLAPLPVEDLAAVVNGYLRTAELDRPVLVGHSMGGQVVLEAVLQDPERVPAVVLLACVVDPRARSASRQGLRLLADSLVETPSANWSVLREYARTGPRWFLRTLPSMLGYRTEQAVARVPVPVLVLRGSRDPVVGHDWAEHLQGLAPEARLVEVPGGGHAVMFTHPEEVAAQILSHGRSTAWRPTQGATGDGEPS